jgi:hypothetical protein
MKKYYSILLFTSLHSFIQTTNAAIHPNSLEALYASGKISVNFIGKGGHQNNCVQLVLKNNAADSVYGFVEAGRRLNSVNDSEQDILLVKSANFRLGARQKDTLELIGFCCQSKKSSPVKGSLFTIGAMAPAIWLLITNLIDRENFPADAIQNAIWVLSDNHDIRSIPAYRAPAMDRLRHTVADILDIDLPWYSFRYEGDSAHLFTGTKTHFFAQIAFDIPQRAIITPQVALPNGEIIYTGDSEHFKAGENVIAVEFPIQNWTETEYDLFLTEDFHTTNKKLRFTLKDNQQPMSDH